MTRPRLNAHSEQDLRQAKEWLIPLLAASFTIGAIATDKVIQLRSILLNNSEQRAGEYADGSVKKAPVVSERADY
jgi:hypothetical protein